MRNIAKTSCITFVLLCLVILKATGRPVVFISDGVDNLQDKQSNLLQLKGEDYPASEQMYGFLPCSGNIFGHLFLIVVYEYLLFHGESYAAAGSEQLFKILGPGVFGASAFQLFNSLPESLILLASGLLERKEVAEEYVYTAVGLLAGSSIFLLTILWGTCIIVGSRQISTFLDQNISSGSNSRLSEFQRVLFPIAGYGITTDSETSLTAKIMLLSVIPFFILQVPKIFLLSAHIYGVILFALAISVLLLLLYFFYETFEPRIQQRRLEYVKHKNLISTILHHVQRHARLLTEDGAPDPHAIRRLFEEIDQDCDDRITTADVKELILQINMKRSDSFVDEAAKEMMKEFDLDGDEHISKDEFMHVFTRWLNGTKKFTNMRSQIKRSLRDLYRVYQLQKKRKEQEVKQQIMSAILIHIQDIARENLLKADGTPNEFAIRQLFERFERREYISKVELKELIVDINFSNPQLNVDEIVKRVMEEVDVTGDGLISEEEFIQGVSKWLHLSNSQILDPANFEVEAYQNNWKETDMLLNEETNDGAADKSYWACTRAIMLMIIGVVMLSVLAEPLVHSVQNFSKAAGINSFTISFILVPWASNARIATAAISAASNKKLRTTSLTFSEIYNSVFMNNVLGVTVLLSLVYGRGMTWEFSAELLVVLIVCATMGLSASFCSTFPIWSSIVAYLFYPPSLLMVSLLNHFNYVRKS